MPATRRSRRSRRSRPAVGGALAALNTLVVWGGMGLGLYGGIVEDEWAFAVKGLACLVARQAFGLATRLPVPPGYRAGRGRLATGLPGPHLQSVGPRPRQVATLARGSCGGAATTGAQGRGGGQRASSG